MGNDKKNPCWGLKGLDLEACKAGQKERQEREAPIKKARARGEKIGGAIGFKGGTALGLAAGRGRVVPTAAGGIGAGVVLGHLGKKIGGAVAERRARRKQAGKWVVGENLTSEGRKRGSTRRKKKRKNEAHYKANLKKLKESKK